MLPVFDPLRILLLFSGGGRRRDVTFCGCGDDSGRRKTRKPIDWRPRRMRRSLGFQINDDVKFYMLRNASRPDHSNSHPCTPSLAINRLRVFVSERLQKMDGLWENTLWPRPTDPSLFFCCSSASSLLLLLPLVSRFKPSSSFSSNKPPISSL